MREEKEGTQEGGRREGEGLHGGRGQGEAGERALRIKGDEAPEEGSGPRLSRWMPWVQARPFRQVQEGAEQQGLDILRGLGVGCAGTDDPA